MKRLTGFTAALALPFALAGCPGDDTGEETAGNTTTDSTDPTAGTMDDTGTPAGCVGPDGPRMEVPQAIDGDTTLTCDTVWVLTGITFVRSGTLTIEPGTTVLGTAGTALVITADATLAAVGTAEAPIVMTSINAVDGNPARGDWGGVALLGTAVVNVAGGQSVAEGFSENPPTYGGNDPTHDCGSLRYLRVEWAGNEVSPGNELNGITFYACGTRTAVDHVQVHMGLDDGLEMFGGGFDASHLVVTGAADDSIDVDEGFSGTLRHVFIQQDPSGGDNCLEWSNQGTSFTATPTTDPTIENLTCVGTGSAGTDSKGATLKEGVQGTIRRSLFIDIPNAAIVLANRATQANAEAGDIALPGTHFCGAATFRVDAGNDMATWTDETFAAWITDTAGATVGTDCMLPSTAFGAPSIKPAAVIAGDGGYAGAVDPDAADDWTQASWINYAI
jgi:hypothetical protein